MRKDLRSCRLEEVDPESGDREMFSPSWSPDGRRLVLSRSADGDADPDLYIVDVETGVESRLTHSPGWDWTPVWG